MVKKWLILSSLLVLTACQQLPVGETVNMPKPQVIADDDNDGVPNNIDKCPYTPEEERSSVYDEGCTMPNYEPALGMTLRFFYENNISYPKEQFLIQIQKVAEKMQEFPKSFIQLDGHASKAEKNPDSISHERAITVAQILKEKYGISENRIGITSYGSQRPIASNATVEGRAMNRRIYAMIFPNKPILNN